MGRRKENKVKLKFRIMKKLLTTILLMGYGVLSAQSPSETQYGAFLTASKTLWEQSVKQAAKEHGDQSFEAAIAYMGLLNNTMATQDEDTFDEYIDTTVDLLKSIIETNPDSGEPKAVLSSVYGLIMAYSPMKGMLYGSKSNSLMDAAIKSDPNSPLVQKLYAGSKLYTPKMFGGNSKEAVASYEKSVEIFEKGETASNWLYLDALMGLSLAYQKVERVEDAKKTLNKALNIEPEFGWAMGVLAELNQSK